MNFRQCYAPELNGELTESDAATIYLRLAMIIRQPSAEFASIIIDTVATSASDT